MTRSADILKAHWADLERALDHSLGVEGATVWDELNAARESALLHAKALDETRRDLKRAAVRLRGVEDQNQLLRGRLAVHEALIVEVKRRLKKDDAAEVLRFLESVCAF